MNVLITGASGFIGRGLIDELLPNPAYRLAALVRGTSRGLPPDIRPIEIETIDKTTDYGNRLAGFDVLIHLAARVHRQNESGAESYPAYRAVNAEGTLNLAAQAAAAGVGRFIFLSSIKVNGETTAPGRPFTADDPPLPYDPYAVSKYEAERGLMALSRSTGMAYVIIRPPLVYGPGVKANFERMMAMIKSGIPLPLGAVHNHRSLVSRDNLVSLVRCCIDHSDAANEVFLVSDDRDVSTTELLRILAAAMEKRPKLIPLPSPLLRLAAKLLGKGDLAQRLLDNLQVDISKTQRLLDWRPVLSLEEGIRLTAKSYLRQIP